MHTNKPDLDTFCTREWLPAVILHAQGRRLTAALAEALTADKFALAIGSDVSAVAMESFDVIVAERDHVDAQDIIDDLRRCFPATRMVSIVTIGAVTIVQAFAIIPRAPDVERLRTLAASIRRAIASAAPAMAKASAC